MTHEHDTDPPVPDFGDTPTGRHHRLLGDFEEMATVREGRMVRRALMWTLAAAVIPAVLGVGGMFLVARDTAAAVDRLTTQVERHDESLRETAEWRAGFERLVQERAARSDERWADVRQRLDGIDARLERIEDRLPARRRQH